jgi:hypothetical protein
VTNRFGHYDLDVRASRLLALKFLNLEWITAIEHEREGISGIGDFDLAEMQLSMVIRTDRNDINRAKNTSPKNGNRNDMVGFYVETAIRFDEISPRTTPGQGFDGTYSGPVVLSGLFNDPTCQTTMVPYRSIVIKNNHVNATILDAAFSIDIPANGVFNASAIRLTDHARANITGRIAGRTMELEYHNAYCEMHASLTATGGPPIGGPNPVPAPLPVPIPSASPRPPPVPAPAPNPTPSSAPAPIPMPTPAPVPSPTSEACRKFPNLCP